MTIIKDRSVGEGKLAGIRPIQDSGDVDALLGIKVHPGIDLEGEVVGHAPSGHSFLGGTLLAKLKGAIVEGEPVSRRVGAGAIEDLVVPGSGPAPRGIRHGRDCETRETKSLVINGKLQATTLDTRRLTCDDGSVSKVGGSVRVIVEVLFISLGDGQAATEEGEGGKEACHLGEHSGMCLHEGFSGFYFWGLFWGLFWGAAGFSGFRQGLSCSLTSNPNGFNRIVSRIISLFG